MSYTKEFSAFDWQEIAKMVGARSATVTEREVRFHLAPSDGRPAMDVLVGDNGGEVCVYEVVLRPLHAGLPYSVSRGPEVSNFTMAARIGWAVRGEPIDWNFHCPDEVAPAPAVPPFQAYLLRMGFEHCVHREDGFGADLYEKQREGAPSTQVYVSAPGGYGYAVAKTRRGGGKPVRVYEGHSAEAARATVEKLLRAPVRRSRRRKAAPEVRPESAITCTSCQRYTHGKRKGAGHRACGSPGCECYCTRIRVVSHGAVQ